MQFFSSFWSDQLRAEAIFPQGQIQLLNDYARHFHPDGWCKNGKQRQIRDWGPTTLDRINGTANPHPTPTPSKSRMKPREVEGKNAPFSHFWFGGEEGGGGGGETRFFICFVQDCSLTTRLPYNVIHWINHNPPDNNCVIQWILPEFAQVSLLAGGLSSA